MPTFRSKAVRWIVSTAKKTPATASALNTVRKTVKGTPVGAAQPLVPHEPRPAVHLQVCAHADDDLYFMNPDVLRAVRSGDPVITVYLTSGEADGKNVADTDPAREATPVDFPGYVAARMNGLRAAYAYMATGDRAVPWKREARYAPNGASMEVAVLSSDPQIKLVFVSLSAGPRNRTAKRLCRLWDGRDSAQPTLPPEGSPMAEAGEYTRDQLVELLVELFREHRPTVVRTLDPDPEHSAVREDGHVEYSDHADHTAAAYFALEALKRYQESGGDPVSVQSYRGYYNRHWPLNLDPDSYERKASLLDIYGGADPHRCANPAGCGDFKIGGGTRSRRYGRSTRLSHPETVSWLARQGDGRLAAFTVLGGVPVQWSETEPGSGRWEGPIPLDIAGVLNELTVATQPDGRLRLIGIRMRLAAKYADQRREIVTTVQQEVGGAFGPWLGLANPHYGKGWFKTHEIGMPVVGVNEDGRAQLFVRNFGMGLSSRIEETPGRWLDWLDLGGSQLQGGLTTVRVGGRIEVFGNTLTGLQHYAQAGPNGGFRAQHLECGPMAGRPTAVVDGRGALMLFYRPAERETVMVLRRLGPDGEWAEPAALPGHGGVGTVAASAVGADGRGLLVAKRNRDGGVSHTLLRSAEEAGRERPDWIAHGGLIVGAPSVALDAAGHAVIAAIGPDRQLYLTRQQDPSDPARFEPWQAF